MNKVLVTVEVPILEKEYDIFIPVNKKILLVIELVGSAVKELSNDEYKLRPNSYLYNKMTGLPYDTNNTVKEDGIKNGDRIILL